MLRMIAKSVGRLIRPAGNVRVVVLGHQKTGTTAIAALLGRVSGLDVSIDPLFQVDQGRGHAVQRLIKQPEILGMLCRRHPNLLGRSIIKDPDLIFVFALVQKCYRHAQYLFVVRDPRDTIRSICNRLGLSGTDLNNCPNVSEMKGGTRHWELVLSGRIPKQGMNIDYSSSLVFNLAHRWNNAAEIYLEHAGEMTCIKYEDFLRDKEKYIVQLANDLRLPSYISISDYVDIQYQPKGEPKTDWLEFFGRDHLCIIENICAVSMSEFGYR